MDVGWLPEVVIYIHHPSTIAFSASDKIKMEYTSNKVKLTILYKHMNKTMEHTITILQMFFDG